MSPGPQPARPLLLFSSDRDLRAEARRALAAAGPVRSAPSWAAFRKRATGSLCAVAVLPGARGKQEHAEEFAALWSAAADRLGVGPQALRRTSRSLMDTDFRGLDRAGIAAVFEGFERRVLIPLEERSPRDRVS